MPCCALLCRQTQSFLKLARELDDTKHHLVLLEAEAEGLRKTLMDTQAHHAEQVTR